jgi:hypothetical protein
MRRCRSLLLLLGDGVIVHVKLYTSQADALEAVGLSE